MFFTNVTHDTFTIQLITARPESAVLPSAGQAVIVRQLLDVVVSGKMFRNFVPGDPYSAHVPVAVYPLADVEHRLFRRERLFRQRRGPGRGVRRIANERVVAARVSMAV